MKKDKVHKAESIALDNFDKWNNTTGFVEKDTGYYYELQSIIEDSVHAGIQMALNGNVQFNGDGEIDVKKSYE